MSRAFAVVVLVALLSGCAGAGGDGIASSTSSTATLGAGGTASSTAGGGTTEPPRSGEVTPGDRWAIADPTSHGIDPSGLERSRAYAFGKGKNTQGVVVVHRGEIVAEWYADDAGPDSWAASWSMAKSFTSATVGIAMAQGKIRGVDEPMATYLPAWAGSSHKDVTIRDVLQMSSGLGWNEEYDDVESDIVKMVLTQPDELAFALSRPQANEPGKKFSYSSGDTMLLSGLVQNATGRPLADYAKENLLDRIGMQKVEWWRDAAGHTLGYCCFDSTSRDFARLGLLYLRGGRWGDQQVVPEQWVKDSVSPATQAKGEYGYQWWTYDVPGVPADIFAAIGVDEQYIYVIPSLDLVVVRSGTYGKDPGPPVADPNLYMRYPSAGIGQGKGTTPPDDWKTEQFLGPIVEAVKH